MSYQAHTYVCDLRGVTRGEKAVLQVIARHLDQRTRVARVSQEQIGADAEMSERHVMTLLAGMESRGVIARQRQHKGRGAVTLFRFPGFAGKGEVASSFAAVERVNSVAQKGEIRAGKGEVTSSCNKERKKNQELQVKTLPNPPLQGGNKNFKLSRRDHTRISRWIEKTDRPNDIGVGKLGGKNWSDIIRLACLELMIPMEGARHDLLAMDEETWSARFELRKPVQAAVGT